MGITSSLYVALSGLNLSQVGMEVASHNIANVNTPGYSRQRVNLETTPTQNLGYGQMGTGVTAQNIERFHDEFLTSSIVSKSSEFGAQAAQKGAIDSLEAFFNESDGNGINASLNEFFAAWDYVADASELGPTREELVSVAQTLADMLNMRREDMDAVRDDLNQRISDAVIDINSLAEGIAKLNEEIMRDEDPSRNQEANDLRDARDALLVQLGEVVGINYWEDPTNGAINVTFEDGPALVINGTNYKVGTETDDSGDIHVIANHRRTEPPWEENVTSRIEGGTVGGWINFRDETLRDFYLQYESFVDQLTFQTNNQHAQGVGLELYDDVTASSLVSNRPATTVSFSGADNDLKITAMASHLAQNEPYSNYSDPENISIRFVKADQITNEITSTVEWNGDPGVEKWEITVALPVDSNGEIRATAEDFIRHVNEERSSNIGTSPTLPPLEEPFKIGDFISVSAAVNNNWDGNLDFPTGASAYPAGPDAYFTLDRSLANTAAQGHHLSYGSENATLTTSFKHTNNDVIFTAIGDYSGSVGENISIEYNATDPNTGGLALNQPLTVDVRTDIDGTKRVQINLATDENGEITTTAADIVELIKSDYETRDMLNAATPADQTGLGPVEAMEPTYLDRSGSFEIVVYNGEGDDREVNIYKVTVDPTDTLEDVAAQIGNSLGAEVEGVRAEIVTDLNGQSTLRLVADAEAGYEFGFRNDTSGALAVLGINNIFTGDSSNTIDVNQDLKDNPSLLAAGRITSDGEMKAGDNTNALDLANLKDERYSFYNQGDATLGTSFNTFYAEIGATNQNITTQYDFLYGSLSDLNGQLDALAGVNLDEELSDVLRYQYMYQASAKIVTSIDEMMQTLLAMR